MKAGNKLKAAFATELYEDLVRDSFRWKQGRVQNNDRRNGGNRNGNNRNLGGGDSNNGGSEAAGAVVPDHILAKRSAIPLLQVVQMAAPLASMPQLQRGDANEDYQELLCQRLLLERTVDLAPFLLSLTSSFGEGERKFIRN
jgi:hypothetical protein